MRTGSTNSDIMMLVVPLAVSFGLVILMSGGVEPFLTLVDVTVRQCVSTAALWLGSR
jgi:hypothetical protein